MKYHELRTVTRATSKRVGRGIASGKGKTAGRGTKGQGARTGKKLRPGFEGGQNPLMQRLPKLPGFRSRRAKLATVAVGALEQFGGKTIDTALLSKHGLLASPYEPVKVIVGRGTLTKSVTVKLQGASAAAIALIEQAGGSFERTARPQRPASAPADDTTKE